MQNLVDEYTLFIQRKNKTNPYKTKSRRTGIRGDNGFSNDLLVM
jgi:hypothetical protein